MSATTECAEEAAFCGAAHLPIAEERLARGAGGRGRPRPRGGGAIPVAVPGVLGESAGVIEGSRNLASIGIGGIFAAGPAFEVVALVGLFAPCGSGMTAPTPASTPWLLELTGVII